ncbi:degenerin mec-10-like [Ruditapes philippinarum]|uniref:degenerin mec-10-like n=1 Tax=Ruditapes philippinarum TaxID=129788 RepID=UPI00295A8CF2|nr:degenerin mec-10-like [Ruditapes philippinarum]
MNPMKQEYIDNFTNISELNLYTQQAIYSAIFSNEPEEELYNNTKDKFDDWKTRFLTEFEKLTDEERLKAGHQKEDFIHSASFSGFKLPRSKFRTIQSRMFGNCFTLDDDEVVARGSGRKNSLYIVLNIETEEYLEQFTSSYGIRMVIHEKGTYPLPEKEGITLGFKTETHVGLRVTTMDRLGGKYGKCTDGLEFRAKYKMNYTIPLCYSLCEMEHTIKYCKCRLRSSLGAVNPADERYCDFDDDEECFENVTQQILNKNIRCDCFSRCEQVVYSSTVSSSSWPHKHYLRNVLLTDICKRKPESLEHIGDPSRPVCDKITVHFEGMTDAEEDAISRNFLAVYIYFQDLTYEVISEQALYNTERFLSDIGGAMGLFVGASVLTCVEILQVCLEILLWFRRRRQTDNYE